MKNRFGIFLKILMLFAGSLCSILRTQAAIENFDGYSASLFGKSGGSSSGSIAWTANWGDQGFASSPNIIQSAMGTVNGFGSSSPFAEYKLDNSAGGINVAEATRTFTSVGNNSTTALYVYFLVARGGDNNASSYGGVGLYNGTTEQFLIGERFGESNWGATAGGNLGSGGNVSSTAIGNFTTTLLLAKINQQANTLAFYVNPNFSQTEAQNTAAFTLSYGTGADTIDTIRLRGGNANNGDTWQWDNVNITFDSPFTPVPEPTTIALGIFGGLALAGLVIRKVRAAGSFKLKQFAFAPSL